MSLSTKRLMRLLVDAPVPEADWRKAYRLAFAQLRSEVELHPRGATPAALFEVAAQSTRAMAVESLPLAMGLVMHLYPLGALRWIPLPRFSAANLRRHRLSRTIEKQRLILANAGSERVAGTQSPVTLTPTRGGAFVDGVFDYVSLANVADLVLFNAPLSNGVSVFCIADLRGDTAKIGTARFSGGARLSDTCSVTFQNHWITRDRFVVAPTESALGCMTLYQRSWFHLLACEAHLARIEQLRRRWNLPRTSEVLAGLNELSVMRDYALRLLNEARSVDQVDALFRVTAALKLRMSWHCQALATSLATLDPESATELTFLARQPTCDDRILSGICAHRASFNEREALMEAPCRAAFQLTPHS